MPIPWLSTLKAIPWSNVIEHAPKVLDKARNLIDRQRSQAPISTPTPTESFTPSEIEIHLATARIEIKELQEKQKSFEGIVTELAQQQVALVGQIKRLRSLSRWLALLLIALGASAWFFFR
jgi:hypothetical protein